MTNTNASGWYLVSPEGSAWVAVEIENGRMVNQVAKSSAASHRRAGDHLARICDAIDSDEVSTDVSLDVAREVVDAWDADADLECCVVERIVLA